MGNQLSLNLLYNFSNAIKGEKTFSLYRVLDIVSQGGALPEHSFNKIYESYPQVGPDDWLCFGQLDQLSDFAQKVGIEIGAKEVFLLSAQDYNLGLEGSHDMQSYREIFSRYGTRIEISTDHKKHTSLLKKIFN